MHIFQIEYACLVWNLSEAAWTTNTALEKTMFLISPSKDLWKAAHCFPWFGTVVWNEWRQTWQRARVDFVEVLTSRSAVSFELVTI